MDAPADASFAAVLAARARRHPARTALVEGGAGGREIAFGAFDALADAYARGLARHGVRPGDRALYLLRPSIDGFAVFFALLRLGAVPVLIDPRMPARSLLASIAGVRPEVVLAVPLVHAVRTLLARRAFAGARVLVTAGRRWFWGGVRLSQCRLDGGAVPAVAAAPGDESLRPFTSGSTGAAKGVFYDHGMLRHQVAVVRDVCGWDEGMRAVICFAPFVAYALADGLTVVLPEIDFSRPAAAAPARVAAAVAGHRAECAFAAPIVWRRLARHCQHQGIGLPALERAVAAGAPAPVDLHRRLAPLLHPHGRLYTPYGSTEAMPLTTAHTAELAGTWERTRDGHGLCVGRPLPGVDLRIVRVTDEPIAAWSDDLEVPEGEIGEIVAGGDLVSPAYPGRPEATAAAKIRRGDRVLHRMGDLGRRDGDGRIWFCGRKDHRLLTRDGMLPADPIENVLDQHPAVFRTAVVAVGAAGEQTPVACVEMEAGEAFSPRLAAELSELAAGTRFAGVVRHFLPHRSFPVDARHNSKIRREELARWAAAVLGRRRRAA